MDHEPFIDAEFPGPLQSLWENGLAVEEMQTYCRDRYLIWHRARLSAVVNWIRSLRSDEFPDILVFPEGSIPRKFLSCLHKKLKKHDGTNPTIFAGTHAFEPTQDAWEDYDRLGVSKGAFSRLCRLNLDSVSVCPILHQDGSVTLQPKTLLSPWEVTAIGLPDPPYSCILPDPITHKLSDTESLQVSALVCSEALQHLLGQNTPPDLLVVLSFNQDHRKFKSIEDHYAMNQIPVAYCNDGMFGGSHINVVNDDRNENWLHNEPRNGVLPPGDGIVLWQTTIKRVAPSMGINNPLPTSRLLRLSSIVPEDESDTAYRVSLVLGHSKRLIEKQIENMAPLEIDGLKTALEQLLECERPTAIQAIQLKRLVGLCRNNSSPLQEWHALATDCVVRRADIAQAQEILSKFAVVASTSRSDTEQGTPPLPSSLTKLEQGLSDYCLAGLGTLLEKASGKATETILAARQRLLQHVGLSAHPTPAISMSELLAQIREESMESATVQLSNELARIVEKFGATSGMLFIAQPVSTARRGTSTLLVSKIMVNTPVQRIEREVSHGAGIVGHVGFTKRPYLSDRVVTDTLETDPFLDPYYRISVPTTMSVMAVPIIAHSVDGITPELIGVLNLESRRPGAFSPLQLQALQSEATRLMVDVRVIQASNDPHAAVVWHPRVHGWGLRGVLDRICYRVATAQSRGSRPPTISCTIWCHDSPKDVLFVRGTSRYDFEYINHEMLNAKDSFLGDQLQELQNGQVRQGQVGDLPKFSRRRKAEQMELAGVSVCPFGIRRTIGESNRGILAIYSFAHESKAPTDADFAAFPPSTVSRLATIIGEVVSQLHKQRTNCATAHLESTIALASALPNDRFSQLRNELCKILEADQCSLFEIRNGKAMIVSTTGVDNETGKYSRSRRNSGTSRQGFTSTLMHAPGLTLRKHDVPNPHEKCAVANEVVTVLPQNLVKEVGAVTESEHRRFLGASIANDGTVRGVVRLIRSEQGRPFVVADEDLLRTLVVQLADLFAENAVLSAVGGKSTSPNEVPAFGIGPWSERALDAWLQQYRTLCGELSSENPPALSNLRFATRDIRGEWGLRILSYHSKLTQTCHRNEDDSPIRRPNIGWVTIDSSLSHQLSMPSPRIVTFDRRMTSLYDCGMDHGIDVQSGLCIPVYWIAAARLVPGVVAVDSDGKPKWNGDGIRRAFMKTLELSGMTRPCPICCDNMGEPLSEWLKRLHNQFQDVCLLWRPTDESDFDLRNQLVPSQSQTQFSKDQLRQIQKCEWRYSAWEPRVSWLHNLNLLGVRFSLDEGLMWIPLRLGPFLLFGLLARVNKRWLTDARKRAIQSSEMVAYGNSGRRTREEQQEGIERLTGVQLADMFLFREVQTIAEEITNSWALKHFREMHLWDTVELRMSKMNHNLASNIDTRGLQFWGPTISKKQTRSSSYRSRRSIASR